MRTPRHVRRNQPICPARHRSRRRNLDSAGHGKAAGVSFETEFLKGLFDKIDVTPGNISLLRIQERAELHNETGYTEPHREAMTVLRSLFGMRRWTTSLLTAACRWMPHAALESGPKTAEQVIALKLMDKEGYPRAG
ncbi:MAG: hypothetical protein R3C04_02875 [Hyphomonas sp.]